MVPLFLSKQRRLRRSRAFLAFLSVHLPPVVSHLCDYLARDCCRIVMHEHPTPEVFGRNRQSVWRTPPTGVCQQSCARETQKTTPPRMIQGTREIKAKTRVRVLASTAMLPGELVSLVSNKRYVVNQRRRSTKATKTAKAISMTGSPKHRDIHLVRNLFSTAQP